MISAFSNTSRDVADYNITHIMVIGYMDVTMPNTIHLKNYGYRYTGSQSFGIFSKKNAKCPVGDRIAIS